MHRTRTEASGIASRGIDTAADLPNGLGHISAAPLVHIPDGFLRGLDDVVHFLRTEIGLGEELKEIRYSSGLGGQILKHDMRAEDSVELVGSFDAAYQTACMIEALCMVILDHMLQFGEIHAFCIQLSEKLIYNLQFLPFFQLNFGGPLEAVFQYDQIKDIYDLDEADELIFCIDGSERPIYGSGGQVILLPGALMALQQLWLDIADVYLIRGIFHHFVKGPQGLLKVLEVF